MMLPRPSDRSSHLPEEHRLDTLISQFCTFSIFTEGGTLAAHGLREPGRVYECRQKSGSADRAVLASDRYAKLAFVPPIYPPTGTRCIHVARQPAAAALRKPLHVYHINPPPSSHEACPRPASSRSPSRPVAHRCISTSAR